MHLNKIKLDSIASLISSGLVVKRKQAMLTSEAVKEYKMLTLKSFEQSGWLNTQELDTFLSNEVLDEKYLTQKGDIIVRLSSPNTAIAIDAESEGFLVTSLFVIIRLKSLKLNSLGLNTEKVLPQYLGVFLNSEYMKKIYAKSYVGSAIQIIKASMLKDVEVVVKSLEEQNKIVELNRLIIKEKKLLKELTDEKEKLHTAIISRMF